MPQADAVATVLRKQKARRSQAIGAAAEGVVRHRLQALGLRMIRRVHTGCVYHPKLRQWRPAEQVEGDWRAVAPGGRSVLVESKARDRDVRWSDFEAHQVDALEAHQRVGGMSLVAVCHPADGIAILWWPLLRTRGFGPGTSINRDMRESCAVGAL